MATLLLSLQTSFFQIVVLMNKNVNLDLQNKWKMFRHKTDVSFQKQHVVKGGKR